MSVIVVDTSVFVAIYKKEPPAKALQFRLGRASTAIVPATCFVEIALLRRIDENLLAWAQDLVSRAPFQLVDITLPESAIASDAAQRFGKGSGHAAQLNFGDCLVYAAAKYRNIPLLFVGNDFRLTDIQPALAPE